MSHDNIKELIQLALLGELNDEEMAELHKHLIECDDCQAEYDALSKYYSFIEENKGSAPYDSLLPEARTQFRAALDYEISKQPFGRKLLNSIERFFYTNKKPAWAGAFSLAAGLVIGYLISGPSGANAPFGGELAQGGSEKITNVRFSNSLQTDGQIEFTFDAVKQIKMKGSLENPAIQKVLAQALINDQNTATRLRTVNTIADQSNKKVMADPDVKSALISAAEHDSNPGVRRQAVMTLLELPYDSEIKNCYLNVLTNDPNSAIRMMAINGLAAANLNGHPLDEEILKVLNQKSKNDDNAYVRIRAASLMKEDKIQ